MSFPSCILNNLIVELPKAFQDELISSGGMKFYQDTTFRPEWNATISGKVLSIPKKLTIGGSTIDPDRIRIKQIIKPGDEIIFSYLVVMNRQQTDNAGEIFIREQPRDPYTTVWQNPNGLQIVRIYLNNDKYEIGLFDTSTKIWIDRIKGNEHDVENFMAKYMPTENHWFNYKNLFPYDGRDYWLVDYSNAIAIKRAEGIFDMVGDFVLIEPIREPVRLDYQGVLEIYNLEQDTDFRAIGKVISIGVALTGDKKLSVKPNETIVTDIRYVQKYEIDGKDYWIVRQKHIYGKAVTHEHLGN